jgi:hypothetical protein
MHTMDGTDRRGHRALSCHPPPQRRRQELTTKRTVVVALVEIRAEVMSIEVAENVSDLERVELRLLDRGKPAAIVDGLE